MVLCVMKSPCHLWGLISATFDAISYFIELNVRMRLCMCGILLFTLFNNIGKKRYDPLCVILAVAVFTEAFKYLFILSCH